MVVDKEVDKVADMVAGHGCWLIGPKLFRPKPYPACGSSLEAFRVFEMIMLVMVLNDKNCDEDTNVYFVKQRRRLKVI